MKILMLPSFYPTKDNPVLGIFFRDQAKALQRHGHKINVIVTYLRSLTKLPKNFKKLRYVIDRENDSGIITYRSFVWNFSPLFLRGKTYIHLNSGLRLFEHYLSDFGRPDIIHAHCALYSGALAARIKEKYSIPYVLTEHSSYYSTNSIPMHNKKLIIDAFDKADSKIFVSPSLGRELESLFGKVVYPWKWVPNLINNQFNNAQCNNSTINPKGKFIFLNIAIMKEIKGQQDLLLAFSKAFRGNKDIMLKIGGDGPLRNDLETLANKLAIFDQVHFLGMLSRNEVLKEMQKANAFILSSHYETFGVVLIEALSCGTPIIATACGGPKYIVNEKNGLLVSPQNVKKLAAAMIDMQSNIQKYKPEQIRDDCLLRFGEKTIVNQLSIIYREVLSKNTKAPNTVN
jgi:glycosyltransferase involved in cell wall biosynthesis